MQPSTKFQIAKPSWQNEFRSSLKNFKEIKSFFQLNYDLELPYTSFIPVNFANKIKAHGPNSPLWRQFIPSPDELDPSGRIDPIGDLENSKGSGIIHRYQNRILYTPTSNCPIICRYCFRKNELSSGSEIFQKNLTKLAEYLSQHPEVNEVILTGGDPLIISNSKLDEIFRVLYQSQISFLRIHTRTPTILPSRIDAGFIDLLKNYETKFQRINFVVHTNHTDELDEEVIVSLNKLRETSIKKLTQSVLLKGVNDSTDELVSLIKKIISVDFSPYYLHHPDQAKGAMHFHLSLERGREIYSKLRNQLPGWAIPHYIIDQFEGQGKQLAFNPEKIEFSGKMLNKNGNLVSY